MRSAGEIRDGGHEPVCLPELGQRDGCAHHDHVPGEPLDRDDTLGGLLGPRPPRSALSPPDARNAAPGPSSAADAPPTGRCIGCRHPSGSTCGGCGALVDDGWDGRTSGSPVPGDLLDWSAPHAGPEFPDAWPDYPLAAVVSCGLCGESWSWSFEVPDRINHAEANARARLHVVEAHGRDGLGDVWTEFLR